MTQCQNCQKGPVGRLLALLALRAPGCMFMVQAGQMALAGRLTGNSLPTQACPGVRWEALTETGSVRAEGWRDQAEEHPDRGRTGVEGVAG